MNIEVNRKTTSKTSIELYVWVCFSLRIQLFLYNFFLQEFRLEHYGAMRIKLNHETLNFIRVLCLYLDIFSFTLFRHSVCSCLPRSFHFKKKNCRSKCANEKFTCNLLIVFGQTDHHIWPIISIKIKRIIVR